MKKRFALVLAILMVVAVSACGKDQSESTLPDTPSATEATTPPETEPPATEPPEASWPLTYVPVYEENPAYLNLDQQNRVQNNGSFLIAGDWVYGHGWDSRGNSQLIKTRVGGGDRTVLDDGFAKNIYTIGDQLYYMKGHVEDYGIYRMDINGENKQLLVKAFGSMQIVGDFIYYIDYTDEALNDRVSGNTPYCHLYRCDLNGENQTEIIAKPVFHAFVFADGILYQDDPDNESLHICDLDGKNDIKLNDCRSYQPLYDGQFIYYNCIDDNDVSSIRKVKPDGTEDQLVSACQVSEGMFLTPEYIYFVNADDNHRLYRMNKDGSDLTPVLEADNLGFVVLFEDQIKYAKYADDFSYILENTFCDYDGGNSWVFDS